MESVLEKTRFIMKKYNIRADKSLGQNFLINDEVISNIIAASNLSKEDLVIEIGPGLGTLTEYLVEKAGKVIAIELDKRMITILKDRFFQYDNFQIINEDVLKVDLKELISEEKKNGKIKNVKIVANLPYYITTPIIMKLLENQLDINSIIVMIQKEVADRLIAMPGSKLSGAITYAINYYSEAESVMLVPNTSFIPEPDVASEVIKLNVRELPKIKVLSQELLFKIIKISFMQRRKTLLNAIVNGGILSNKVEVAQMLQDLQLDINTRGETLSLETFAKISDYIYKKCLKK